jgi:hypothetical protein
MFGVLALLAALGTVGACRSGDESPPQSTGAVTLALTGTLNGVTYHLRGARFAIAQAGPDLVLDADRDPAATFLTTTLPTGSYSINLESGWALARGDSLQVVDATLTSPNPTPFQIVAASTSNVIFRFSTTGGVVTIGTGTLVVSIDVTVSDGGVASDGASPGCTMSPDSCGVGQVCEAHIESGSVRNICVPAQADAGAPDTAGGSVCPAPAFECANLDLSPAGVEWNASKTEATFDLGPAFGPSSATLEYLSCGNAVIDHRSLTFPAGRALVPFDSTLSTACAVRFTLADRCGTNITFSISVSEATSGTPRFSCG